MTRKMKDSGIEWIGEIPEDWEIRKLGNLSNLYTGNSITDSKKDNYTDSLNSIPYIATKDIKNNHTINYKNGMYVRKDDLGFKVGLKDSTLICIEGGSAGVKIAYLDQDVTFGNKLCAIYSKFINNRYLYYYILSPSFNNSFNSRITGLIPGVTLSEMSTIDIVMPSIIEQKKIAAILDEKVTYIANIQYETQQSIEKLKKYKQSLITEAVTKGLDPNVEMKDSGIEWIGEIPKHWYITRPNIISSIVRGNSRFQKSDMKQNGDYVAVQYGQVYKLDILDENYHSYVDKDFFKADQVVQTGDTILISTSETMEDLGHSCFYNRKDIGLLGGEQLCLKPNREIIFDKFLYYATNYFHLELKQYATGLKVYRFKLDDLKKINIMIPPTIEEQIQIVAYLDEQTSRIDKLIADKTKIIEELESYRQSVIYEYVTGKKEV